MWQQGTAPGTYLWKDALSYCENLTLAGHTDWRLPAFKELESLVNLGGRPAIDMSKFPNTFSANYWSSTTDLNDTYGPSAWDIYFSYGDDDTDAKSSHDYVRCVRGGDPLDYLDHFVISTPSSPPAVGVPFSVTITAVDKGGNRVTGFNGAVRLSNPGGIYPISAKLESGQGTVSVKLYTGADNTRINCSGYGAYGNSKYFSVTSGVACTGSIWGNVIDCNEAAVSGTTVSVYRASDPEGDPVSTTTTDSGGKFTFSSVACGKYEIRAAKDGKGTSRIMREVGATYCTTAYNILIPLNCGTKDTPVVLVPGILGSSKSGAIVPRLPSDMPADASDLRIHAEALTGFDDLRSVLTQLGYHVVECPYDWRINCAKAYEEYLVDKIDEALKESTTGKVHIVAHSMGGLVVRAYIQDKENYRNDIDKVAFVGTPQRGSCNPYCIWEGGDPKLVDNTLYKWYFKALNIYFYTDTLKKLWDSKRRGGWSEWNHKAIRAFVQDETPSLRELMYTEQFLTDYFHEWGVKETGGNVNTWLKELNEGLGDYNAPSSVMSSTGDSGTKVEARVFAGGKDNSTITWVKTALVKGSIGWANDLYEDGIPSVLYFDSIPFANVKWGKGDGTVPYDSAVYPSNSNWAALCPTTSQSGHASLVKDFLGEIVAFLDPEAGSAAARDLSGTTGGAELSVSILGDMRVLVTDSQSRKTGADTATGSPLMEIPDSKCAFDATGGEAGVEDPAAGTYQITYFGGADRDFQIDIEYRDDDVSETYNYRGFRPAAARTFSVVINPSGSPRVTVTTPATAPTNLQANPYISGTEKTRLTWTATGEAGLTGYNIYAVAELEPYFTKVTTVGAGTTSYNTADAWSSDSSTTVKTYAVAAVKTGGIESFFSNLAQNNDRDHDGLSDVEEDGLGTDKTKADTDGDGLKDGEEQAYNASPLLKDTDGDGYNDYIEIQAGSDPLDDQSVPVADISVEKWVNDSNAHVGEDVVFTVLLTNNGPGDATGIQITDQLPAGLSYKSNNATQGTYSLATGIWEVGSLANGASATLEITVAVDQTGTFTNTATLTASSHEDPNSQNDKDDAVVSGEVGDISVGKTNLYGISYNSTTPHNELHTIDPATGTISLLNSFDFDTGSYTGIIAVNKSGIFTQSSGGTLYKFDLNTGSILSTFASETQLQNIAAGPSGNLYGISYNSTTSHNELHTIDPATGTISLLNSFDFDTGSYTGIIAVNKSGIFTQSSGGTLYKFDLNTGSILSTFASETQLQNIAAGPSGNLYGISYNSTTSHNELHTIDPATGTISLLNSFDFDTGSYTGIIAVNESGIFTQSSGGTLYKFDLNTGSILSTFASETQLQNIASNQQTNGSINGLLILLLEKN